MNFNDLKQQLNSFSTNWSGIAIVAIDKTADVLFADNPDELLDAIKEKNPADDRIITLATPRVTFQRIAANYPERMLKDEYGVDYATFGNPEVVEIRIYPQVPRAGQLPTVNGVRYDLQHRLIP